MNPVTLQDFDATVLQSKKPVLVDVWAEWCPPCKALMPTLEKLAKAYQDTAIIVKLDGESESKLVETYKVSTLPTLIFFKGGKEVKRFTGIQQENTLKEVMDGLIGND